MTDLADLAQQKQEQIQQQFWRRYQQNNRQSQHNLPCNCIDCDRPIPKQRRVTLPYCTRCVDCQHIIEQQAKYRGK